MHSPEGPDRVADGEGPASRSPASSPANYWQTDGAKVMWEGVEDIGRRLITSRYCGSAGIVANLCRGRGRGRIKVGLAGLSGPLRRAPGVDWKA